jgi:curved DNA-binding protein CbpA
METVDKYFKAFKITSIKIITHQELKRRYRILSKKYHPDKGGTENQFRFVHDAYKYLINLRNDFIKQQNKKFYNNKDLIFYADGSIYSKSKKRWIKFRGQKINTKD